MDDNSRTVTRADERTDDASRAVKFSDMSTSRIVLILSSLGLLTFFFAVEQTIVATAVPGIGAALNAHGSLTWITSSYLLTTTAFQPLTGRLADAIGAKRFLLIEFWIFVVGNIIAGASRNLTQLVAGRLLSGVGGAGLLSVSTVILTDLTNERQRGVYLNLINLVFSFADAIGPLVGGAFVQARQWQWIFYFNAPLAPFITFICIKYIRLPTRRSTDTFRQIASKLDFAGMFFIVAALTFLVVGLNLGGESLPFRSPTIIGLFCASGVSFIAFLVAEKYAEMPLVPLHLYSKWEWRNVPIMMGCRTLLFFPLFVTTFYLPAFLQIKGISAINAGTLVIPFLTMAAFSSTLFSWTASKFDAVRPLFMAGLLVLPISLGLMSTLNETSSLGRIVGYTLLCGFGFGSGTSLTLVIAQVGLPDNVLSTVTAVVGTAPNLGGVLGISIIGSIINTTFRKTLIELMPSSASLKLNDPVSIARGGVVPREVVMHAYVVAWQRAYFVLAGIATFQLLVCLLLRPVELNAEQAETEVQVQEKKEEPEIVEKKKEVGGV